MRLEFRLGLVGQNPLENKCPQFMSSFVQKVTSPSTLRTYSHYITGRRSLVNYSFWMCTMLSSGCSRRLRPGRRHLVHSLKITTARTVPTLHLGSRSTKSIRYHKSSPQPARYPYTNPHAPRNTTTIGSAKVHTSINKVPPVVNGASDVILPQVTKTEASKREAS